MPPMVPKGATSRRNTWRQLIVLKLMAFWAGWVNDFGFTYLTKLGKKNYQVLPSDPFGGFK